MERWGDMQSDIQPMVSIVILHFHDIKDTLWCLKSCMEMEYENFQVVVVCNGTPGSDFDVLNNTAYTHAPCFVVQNEKNLGYAGGMNTGIVESFKNTDVEYVLVLNNDAVLEKSAVSEMVQSAGSAEVDMVAPRLVGLKYPHHTESMGMQLNRGWFPFLRKSQDEHIFCPSGGAALYSRTILEKLYTIDGYYFDPDFFCYNEDVDLGWRARRAGFGVCTAVNAIVYHEWSGSTSVGSSFSVYHSMRNVWWVLVKNMGKGDVWRFGLWIALIWAIFALRYTFSSRIGAFWRAQIDGIKGFSLAISKRKGLYPNMSAERSPRLIPRYLMRPGGND
ncbi:MAG: hypothetical protein A3H59_02565 [Candidatus Jacksonbacteria bacterium RIFCSPLOWO2_02_FULL_43_9]|nr:MAG: hypothetical protein A2986_01635 [Candidatus Jacksonbacteria bacterium RIFCSPLOWO2_01_FULL_44_13]OGY73148.1 MAG: hypothetical protein A3H59_02565 [Candidatus Jacksonbacteria bacterium RIFCSPLOWO2_02_FULL_43_9]HLC95047.1 glycosyltransferase family 2 protein [Patescibacteria group bacterium]